VEIEGYTFKIAKVEKNVIQSVLVKKLEKEEQPESGHEDGTPENK